MAIGQANYNAAVSKETRPVKTPQRVFGSQRRDETGGFMNTGSQTLTQLL